MQLTQSIIDDFKAGRLESFYREAYPSLLLYATRILTDGYAFLAEDCVQDCIFRCYQERHRITTPSAWKAYLYTAVHNATVSILRHHRVQEAFAQEADEAFDVDTSQHYIEQETLDLLYAAIEGLPAKYRTLFELSFEKGLSNPEVAELLHISVSGVKKQKSRLVELLRSSMPGDTLALLPLLCIAG